MVIGHRTNGLHLIAIRETVSGQYIGRDETHEVLRDSERRHAVRVNRVDGWLSAQPDTMPIAERAREVQGRNEGEGAVLAWESGHRVKLKTGWYQAVHSALSFPEQPNRVARAVLLGHACELIDATGLEHRGTVRERAREIEAWTRTSAERIVSEVVQINARAPDRGSFAKAWQATQDHVVGIRVGFETLDRIERQGDPDLETTHRSLCEKLAERCRSPTRYRSEIEPMLG